jgi:tRNA-2-methylthio-N6-dimethylallyladenosine synthase
VCEYLHVPAQSGSDRVLRAMNRRYTIAEYLDLLAAARQMVPNLSIAGDFIVGFPGETEEDFQASCDLVRRAGYKNSFIFRYSPREGTVAARTLADDVPAAEKARRNAELLAVQNEVSRVHHQRLVGSVQQVLVEGPSVRAHKQPRSAPPGTVQLTGRTRGDHIVAFDGAPSLAGQFVNVRVTGATALALTGEASV